MIYFFLALYALLMGSAAWLKRRELGLTLTAGNLLGSMLLLSAPLHPYLVTAGLIGLLACALRNGYVLQGHVRPLHAAVRVVLSLVLFVVYTVA